VIFDRANERFVQAEKRLERADDEGRRRAL
jgi:hypothetical protein